MYIYNKKNNSVEVLGDKGAIDITYATYPVSGTNSWEDKQELVEGRHFDIDQIKTLNQWVTVAIPLPVIKQESIDDTPANSQEETFRLALQKIEQMSDPGSYEKAIVEMKSIATDALKGNAVNSQEEWQLSQQVSDAVEFLKWMQENDCYNGTNGIGFWIMYDIEYSSEELYSLYKQSKPLTP